MREPSEHVWLLQITETNSELWFTAEHLAMHVAERMVGNRSVARLPDGMLLYGPGDGTTSVMIRRFRRSDALQYFPDVTLPI
jgi:hypothetical protein